MKVYFYTLGCRVNQYETDAAREQFIQRGYEITDDPQVADVCIVNTCTVTGEADRKSSQQLRKMARLNKRAIICAMGCAAEMSNGKVDADLLVDRKNRNKIVDRLEEFIATATDRDYEHLLYHSRPEVSKEDEYHEFGTVLSPEGTRAFVKIEDGCNNFCSYCIIPFARGRVSSRDRDNVLQEVNNLAQRNYKEIVISGIHLCSYGKEKGEDIMYLLDLLRDISKIPGIERIRLGSLEPKSLTRDFIKGLYEIGKICPHFHLSLQSGSDSVLKRMNRKYNSSEYLDRVDILREYFPTMSLTTDIICGFPEETEEEFNETLDFVKKAAFTKIHVFPYSLREGTKAASMTQVPGDIKKKRANELIEWSNDAETSFASSKIGHVHEVLVEKCIENADGSVTLVGYTSEYVRAEVVVNTDDLDGFKGQIVKFRADSCEESTIKGTII